MSKTLWISAIVVLVLIVIGIFAFTGTKDNTSTTSTSSPSSDSSSLNSNGNSAGSETINPGAGNDNSGNAAGDSVLAGQKNNVELKGFAFNPRSLTIKKGESVTWTNMDSVAHTVTSDSGSEISSPSLPTGESYSHTFNAAGTYTYHCTPHPSMKGTIIVE